MRIYNHEESGVLGAQQAPFPHPLIPGEGDGFGEKYIFR